MVETSNSQMTLLFQNDKGYGMLTYIDISLATLHCQLEMYFNRFLSNHISWIRLLAKYFEMSLCK